MHSAKHLNYEQALHKAAAYCSLSEKCIYDVQEKLKSWGADIQDQEKIINYLIKEKFIDEKRFALAYVKDKFQYNKWGKIKIRIMLQQKKIPPHIIEDALNQIDEKAYQEMIIHLLADKAKNLTYKDAYDKKAKLIRYLTGKGFEIESVIEVI